MQTYKTSRVGVGLTSLAVLGLVIPLPAEAQFSSESISLHSWIDLGTFGAGSGNDCWGYTSPSGREYALMGLNNQVAFVEITDPANPNWFASIEHSSSIWGDIKVYEDVAYIVTETSGTGVQVVDISNIDSGIVTLVRTISSPGRSHNIAVDTDSGYLYTVLSRAGNATTVIFDLSDPLNPVEVGRWTSREHDAQIVTYTSGPYAGRQIMFGAATGLGLDIIDVTDKSDTFLISRTPYPNVAYCHQVWTEDLQYLYVDDELDSIPRTTVFDITDLANPVFLGDFSSGLGAIDHNLYIRGGFIFEANYRSGLRVFDLNVDPVSPPQVGWFDTYPANDNPGFDGAWSCYPFFPSGTVIVSDMNRGLFVLDVTAAVGCQAAAQCDDGNPCSTDTCDKDGQCVHTIVESGASCDDGNVCTINGQCDADGNCVVTDINTIPCDDDGPCAPGACDTDAGLCVCFPCLRADSPFEETPVTTAKNRYVSFTPANPGESTALRVTLSNLPAPFNAFDGTEIWVGEPRVYCENSGQEIPPAEGCGPAGGLPSLTFLAAPLQCTPLFRDWGSDGPLHVFGDAIVPNARYQIQAISRACYDADVPNFSAALRVTQSKWGDVCGSGPGGGACRGVADGRVEVIQDVLGLIDKFVNINSLQKASADLDPGTPDQKVTIIGDALFALDAFQGASFPFAGPTPCP